MRITLPDPWTFFIVLVVAVALAYVVTGSSIGRVVRTLAVFVFRGTLFTELFFCPPCASTWMGLGVSYLLGLGHIQAIVMALSSCLVGAMVQSMFGLAAEDRCRIAKRLNLSLRGCDGTEEEGNRGGRR